MQIQTQNLKPLHKIILSTLEKHGELTKSQLSSLLEIPVSTVYDNLAQLELKGLVSRRQIYLGRRGRQPVAWFIRRRSEEE